MGNTNYVSKAVKGTPPFVEKNFKPNLDQALFKGLKFTDKIENIKSKEYIQEYNKNKDQSVSLLQIWVFPNKKNVTPRYDQKNIKDIKGTQKIFNHRAEMCSLASQGKWSNELENK